MLSTRSYIQELQLVISYQSLPSGPANAKNISGLLEQDGLGISCPISDGSLADTETLDSFSIGISKLFTCSYNIYPIKQKAYNTHIVAYLTVIWMCSTAVSWNANHY